MSGEGDPVPFHELVAIVDDILDACDDEVPCIVQRLEALDEPVRADLLTSDLLNAYQVFYYFFRLDPGDLIRELLELNPASSLRGGLVIDETDLLEIHFGIRDSKPVVLVSDGDKVVATFSGRSAYGQAREFVTSDGWQ